MGSRLHGLIFKKKIILEILIFFKKSFKTMNIKVSYKTRNVKCSVI
jgi:hypothetical protein